jgi:protein-S-isoprenylcysteine O-methyltransferase Ste14
VFGRAVIAFLALPGLVAYVAPVLLAPSELGAAPWRWAGIVLIAVGTFLLLWCVRDFYVTGKGTLAPWSPPQHLVRAGPYRWSRNPMYVSVLVVVLGWSVLYRSQSLLVYLVALAVAFHLRILLYEEPRLHESFGEDWVRYKQEVRRWASRARQ